MKRESSRRIGNIFTIVFLIASLGVVSGCAGNAGVIKTMSTSTRQNVFQEVTETSPLPQGYATLRVASSLKTHRPGGISEDIHGTAQYKLLVNIDGQAVTLVSLPPEEKRESDSANDPEEGLGMRYLFQKELHLKPGIHRVFVSLPFDELAVEKEIDVAEGSHNVLVIEPKYNSARQKRRTGLYTAASFKEGISGFWVKYNNKKI